MIIIIIIVTIIIVIIIQFTNKNYYFVTFIWIKISKYNDLKNLLHGRSCNSDANVISHLFP